VLPAAVVWAKALQMSLHILTVAEPVPDPVTPGAAASRRVGPDGDVERYVAELVAKWSGSASDVTGSVHWDPISAAAGIRDHLRHQPAGLLAVTTHAREGVQRVVHGAEAANIVRQSVVPVLVLPNLTNS
jgi:nucleotide-binding universal stress UspA family protein